MSAIGPINLRTTTTKYVGANVPRRFVQEVKSTQVANCGWQTEAAPGHLQTICRPVAGHPELQECEVVQVPSKYKRLVPTTCTKDQVTVTQDFVRDTTVETDANGQKTISRVDRPITQTFQTTSKSRRDPANAIEYMELPKPGMSEQKPVVSMNAMVSGGFKKKVGIDVGGSAAVAVAGAQPRVQAQATSTQKPQQAQAQAQKKIGGGSAAKATHSKQKTGGATPVLKTGGATPSKIISTTTTTTTKIASPGATKVSPTMQYYLSPGGSKPEVIQMPNAQQAIEANLRFTADDRDQMEFSRSMMRVPDDVPPPSNENSFYVTAPGEFGKKLAERRAQGFGFPMADQPFEALESSEDRQVLDTLINWVDRLREVDPENFEYSYDIARDTINTLKTALLMYFAKMESVGISVGNEKVVSSPQRFDRAAIFKYKPSSSILRKMDPELRRYVELPPQDVWNSELTMRYWSASSVFTNANENSARQALIDFYNELKNIINDKEKSKQLNIIPMLGLEEGAPMGEIEDNIMAVLAQLQLRGYAVRTSSGAFTNSVEALLSLNNRVYFRVEFLSYLDLYRDGQTPNERLLYLPSLRRQMFAKQNVALPKRRAMLTTPAGWMPRGSLSRADQFYLESA